MIFWRGEELRVFFVCLFILRGFLNPHAQNKFYPKYLISG